MNIIIYCILRSFFRSLEQRADIYVVAHICESGSNNFRPAIMSVLSHFSNIDTGTTAFALFKVICHLTNFLDNIFVSKFAAVDTGN